MSQRLYNLTPAMKVKAAHSYPEWEGGQRVVEMLRTRVRDGVEVVTRFVGVAWEQTDQKGRPLVYETCVEGGVIDGRTKRTATRRDARTAHHLMVVECLTGGITTGKDASL